MKKDSSISQEKRVNTENPLKKTGEIVEKNFVNQNGKVTAQTELYFRASVQDYYIKFCESDITQEELEPYINKVINVEAEIIKGYFDSCPDQITDKESRTGFYIIIKTILK